MKKLRVGTVPAAIGTAVTAAGLALIPVTPLVASGIAGFGLAHVILGGIDLVQPKRRR